MGLTWRTMRVKMNTWVGGSTTRLDQIQTKRTPAMAIEETLRAQLLETVNAELARREKIRRRKRIAISVGIVIALIAAAIGLAHIAG